jgi:hypothetical protein
MRVDPVRDLYLTYDPNHALLFFPVFEQNQSRDSPNAVTSSDHRAVIDVELYETHRPCVLFRYRFNNRRERPARPHHCAQKSTNTGIPDRNAIVSKFLSSTSSIY